MISLYPEQYRFMFPWVSSAEGGYNPGCVHHFSAVAVSGDKVAQTNVADKGWRQKKVTKPRFSLDAATTAGVFQKKSSTAKSPGFSDQKIFFVWGERLNGKEKAMFSMFSYYIYICLSKTFDLWWRFFEREKEKEKKCFFSLIGVLCT